MPSVHLPGGRGRGAETACQVAPSSSTQQTASLAGSLKLPGFRFHMAYTDRQSCALDRAACLLWIAQNQAATFSYSTRGPARLRAVVETTAWIFSLGLARLREERTRRGEFLIEDSQAAFANKPCDSRVSGGTPRRHPVRSSGATFRPPPNRIRLLSS